MKKDQKTYILLIAVLAVWGIIGYQIYTRLESPTPKVKSVQANTTFVREKAIEINFYEVEGVQRDPFLGKYPIKKKTVKKRVVISKPTIPFPNVVYNGIIKGNKTQSYILTINGQQQIVKLGKKLGEIKLISANTKQAVVQFQGVKKTIVIVGQ